MRLFSCMRSLGQGVCLGLCLLLVPVSLRADTEISPTSPLSKAVEVSPLELLRQFPIPEDQGLVTALHAGRPDRTVILIQDAHANLGSQLNAARLLRHLSKHGALQGIAFEGGAGDLDASVLNFYPDAAVRANVSEYFLKQARIGAAEYYAWNSAEPVRLFGAEDAVLYEQNRTAYIKARDASREGRQQLSQLKNLLETLARYIFPESWKELRQSKSRFYSGKISLAEHLAELIRAAAVLEIPQAQLASLKKNLTADALEAAADFTKNNAELDAWIDQLKLILKSDRVSAYLANTAQYRLHKLPRSDYFSFLIAELSRRYGAQPLPEKDRRWVRHLRYVIACDTAAPPILVELTKLETALQAAALRSADAVELEALIKIYEIFNRLYALEWSRDDADFFAEHRGDFNSATFVSRLQPLMKKYHFQKSLPLLAVLDRDLPRVEFFYQKTLERDAALVKNTAAKMESENLKSLVLIAGGFHTRGIERLLKSENYSYVILLPQATGPTSRRDLNNLEEALRLKPLPLEKRMAGLFQKAAAAAARAPLTQMAPPAIFPRQGVDLKKLEARQAAVLKTAARLMFVLGRLLDPAKNDPASFSISAEVVRAFVEPERVVAAAAALRMTEEGVPVLLKFPEDTERTAFVWTPGDLKPRNAAGFRGRKTQLTLHFKDGTLAVYPETDPGLLGFLEYEAETAAKLRQAHSRAEQGDGAKAAEVPQAAAGALQFFTADALASVSKAIMSGPMGAISKKADLNAIAAFQPAQSAAVLRAALSGPHQIFFQDTAAAAPRLQARDKVLAAVRAANALWRDAQGSGYLQALYLEGPGIRESIDMTRAALGTIPNAYATIQEVPDSSADEISEKTRLDLQNELIQAWNFFRVLTAPRDERSMHFRLPAAEADPQLLEEGDEIEAFASLGGYLRVILAAERLGPELGGITPEEAGARIRDLVREMQRMPRYRGFFFRAYTSGRAAQGTYGVSDTNVDFADNKGVESGLQMVLSAVRSQTHALGLPRETLEAIGEILAAMNFQAVFYDVSRHAYRSSLHVDRYGHVEFSKNVWDSLGASCRQALISEVSRIHETERSAYLKGLIEQAGRPASESDADFLLAAADLDERRTFPDTLGRAFAAAAQREKNRSETNLAQGT